MNVDEMRQYIRYKTDIPVVCRSGPTKLEGQPRMINFSKNGLCFTTRERIELDSELSITIPFNKDELEDDGTVMWRMDMESFFSKEPGAVINAAIDKYVYITVNKKFNNEGCFGPFFYEF